METNKHKMETNKHKMETDKHKMETDKHKMETDKHKVKTKKYKIEQKNCLLGHSKIQANARLFPQCIIFPFVAIHLLFLKTFLNFFLSLDQYF